ncbi:MAG: arylsulfatase [Clostridium sp.]|nr:arylsulfatase [Clostridium sp.]
MMVDQMRYDCLGANGNELISTPNLDMMANLGYNFENAYTAVPSCIASRAALMTGLSQKNHGRVGYEDGIPWRYENTLAKEFTSLGYQTECIGKMHVYPERNRLGFEHVQLHDGYLHFSRKYDKPYVDQFENIDDYLSWFREKKGSSLDLMDNGLDCNSWVARPWQHEEELHQTNWVVTKSIEFLKKRDKDVPFFLKMSFTRPHSPLDPPTYYFNMYMNMLNELPDAKIGDWAESIADNIPLTTIATIGKLKKMELKRLIAAYYGLITHIDHQIGRFLISLGEHGLDKNTIIIFLSDHGDQLGEHNLFRKAYPYQGSIHIPLFLYDPGNILKGDIKNINELVEMRDIFPSLVDLAVQKEIPNIDGKSFKECLYNKDYTLRDYIHGEHSFGEYSNQFIVTKEWKYVWFPIKNKEQLFHLKNDPDELKDEINNPKFADVVNKLRNLLIGELTDREEKFVINGKLQKKDYIKPTLSVSKNNY